MPSAHRDDDAARRAAAAGARARALQTGTEGDGPPELDVAALRYDGAQDAAPTLVARGSGWTAQRILELAKEHDLPIKRDPTLVSILGALDVGAEIPPDLYGVIAEVLAWAYYTDQQAASARRAA
jgi:flagellar biosynthesis protein